jgi:hypothetical protein
VLLIMVAAWVGGGALWALGIWGRLHLKRARYAHEWRMAKIAHDRARSVDELEQGRAERASRSRPDIDRAAVAEALAGMDVPADDPAGVPTDAVTEVMAPVAPPVVAVVGEAGTSGPASWPLDRNVEAMDEAGRYRLPTLS